MILSQLPSRLESIGQLICVVLLFFFVLFLAYLAARIAGSLQSNVINKHSNIKVIEVFRLSNNKLIEIVRIGEHYLALAVCKDTVTVLSELNAEEVKEQETALEPIHFKDILDRIKNEKQDKES
ncbi:MAG: flagellar biosynthetic protein FliO [Bacteroidales bacterium]|nr:flagellar biosynthetic protein FliO [Clostridium sp.]MCM1202737.1 flagellar biosynthetic protein FliO [Bacteroidales bacterium]